MKSKELLLKHLALNDCKGYVTSDGRLYKAIIDALEEAINYTHCCKSDSELFYCYLETDKKCEKQCSYCLHIEGSE